MGANVFLVGTSLGCSTDREGTYRMAAVPPGTYVVRISYIGYKTKLMDLRVANSDTLLSVVLAPDVLEGQEVIVTAQLRGQIAAINQQVTANTIVNVVSEEKIQQLPDVNAAEAIGRLPGVSLLRSGGEANKIILRGMSDAFTVVTIDGVRVPPTDVDSRGFDLSTLSQGSLAGIELYKALTPDKDADAIAGSVNLVTRKAPSERVLRVDSKGDYNALMNSANQYDFSLRYGERFLDDIAGVQITGNLEKRIRSSEEDNINYATLYTNGAPSNYNISDFSLQFNDEFRKRNGVSLLLDYDTPDSGSIRFNNSFSKTSRDYATFTRNFPTPDGNDREFYQFEDRQQNLDTYNGSLHGSNNALGLTADWNLSFAQSLGEMPYDYYIDFVESPSLDANGQQTSGMKYPNGFHTQNDPGSLLQYALNNFQAASMDSGIFRSERNLDKEKTASLDLSKKYTIQDWASGELKVGGKYRTKDRSKVESRLFTPYYLTYWQPDVRLPDGSIVPKDFHGTWFDPFFERYLSTGNRIPAASDFLDPLPPSRDLFDQYNLKPLIDVNAMKLWYDLNKNGVSADGRTPEYSVDNTVDANYYDIVERVGGTYAMNTLNLSDAMTLMAGVRVESERNDYTSRFAPQSLGGFPTPTGSIKDTNSTYSEIVWLPNYQLILRPFDFMNVRAAAYRALARPDFNMRLETYVATGGGASNALTVGNDHLRAAKAWNYEVNTSFFEKTIGLFSVSAFYKEIKDMFHVFNGGGLTNNSLLDSLGVHWKEPFGSSSYSLIVPYNSNLPTKVWGFEVEHQANLGFLPGIFHNLVLSYNFSITRSQTHLLATQTVTTYIMIPGFPPLPQYQNIIVDTKQKLEGQPEFYGNAAIGYDVDGFSIRVSVFHQSQFIQSYSADGLNDPVTNAFTRWDLSVKQEIADFISVLVSINNLTNTDEGTATINRVANWNLPTSRTRYGTTGDVGVRLTF